MKLILREFQLQSTHGAITGFFIFCLANSCAPSYSAKQIADEKFVVSKSSCPLGFKLKVPKSVAITSSTNYYSHSFYFFEAQRKPEQRPFLLISVITQKKGHEDSAEKCLAGAMASIRKSKRLNWSESKVESLGLAHLHFVKQTWTANLNSLKEDRKEYGFVFAGEKKGAVILALSTCESPESLKRAEQIFGSLSDVD